MPGPNKSFESVSTDQANIGADLLANSNYAKTESSESNTSVLSSIVETGGEEIQQTRAERNASVGTSAVEILNLSPIEDVNSLLAGHVTVMGREKDGSGGYTNTQFTDLIVFTAAASPVVIGSAERGTPESRSYSSTGGGVELAMGGSDYAVVAATTGGTPDL